MPSGRLREKAHANISVNLYLTTELQVGGLLARGVPVHASKTEGGPLEPVHAAEFTRVETRGFDAIDKKSGKIVLHGLRINGFALIEKLNDPVAAIGGGSAERRENSNPEASLKDRIRNARGDRLPLVIEWAQFRYASEKLPSREAMLKDFRADCGLMLGVNEKTMREVRRRLATLKARRGGAPTQAHHR
jgi:hypothetical protein